MRNIHRLKQLCRRLSQRIDLPVLKLLLETGKLEISSFRHKDRLETRVRDVIDAFNKVSRAHETMEFLLHENAEQGCWQVEFRRRDHGRVIHSRLDKDLASTGEYREAQTLCALVQRVVSGGGNLSREGKNWPVNHYDDIADVVEGEGRKGLSIQRYKGLGEMDPAQLWETTMDPEKRVLLKVSVDDVVAADEIFATLMGDAVEPRRNFIQDNALKVRNLDV